MKFYATCWLFAFLISSLLFSSCKQPKAIKSETKIDSGSFVVNGTFKGVDSGTIYMFSSGKKVDSATVVKSKFLFRGKLSLPEKKSFLVTPGNWWFNAFVDAANITLSIDTSFAILTRVGPTTDNPVISKISESGSPIGDAYAQYENETGLTETYELLREQRAASPDQQERIERRINSIMEVGRTKQRQWIEKYVQQNPASVAGAYIFDEYSTYAAGESAVYLSSVVTKFSGAAKASPHYTSINKKLSVLSGLNMGKTAPGFMLTQRNGSKLNLKDKRGSIVLLDFWASWCNPCRKAIPHWKEVYRKYHAKNFEIISISIDDERKAWIAALDQEKMPWLQVRDVSSSSSALPVERQYGVSSIPFYVLLNKKGEVVLASNNEDGIAEKIRQLSNLN